MNKYSVSVIVPAFKTEKYLELFLGNLKKQTMFSSTQVIIDQNLPTSKEVIIADKYKYEYGDSLKILRSDVLFNIAESMNRCIENSESDYIAIWNVDDLREPNSLYEQFVTLTKSNAVACTGPYRTSRSFGSLGSKIIRDINIPSSKLLTGMYLGPFFMFKRSALGKIGHFDEQLLSGADFDFSIRLARFGDICYSTSILGDYLDEGLGASTRPNSLQPIERTVIELRYGILDSIDKKFLIQALNYRIFELKFGDNFYGVENFFDDYSNYMENRIQQFNYDESFNNLSLFRKFISRLKGRLPR